MTNPWLDIPASDYLGHMGSPQVDQLRLLADVLRDALVANRPRSLLVLGGGTGNGFEHIDPQVTRTVTAIDLNAEYLDLLRQRFPDPGFELTLLREDVTGYAYPRAAFDLVHCALLFEYVDWSSLLPRVVRSLRPRGVLSLVLQLPSAAVPAVTPSPFTSLRRLETLFTFVDPERLMGQAETLGLRLQRRREIAARQGKTFLALELSRSGDATG